MLLVGKPPSEPSSYKPIYLLDTIGKLLKRIINSKLLPLVESQGDLSDRQYWFRKARLTIDAIKLIAGLAEKAIRERWGVRGLQSDDFFYGLIPKSCSTAKVEKIMKLKLYICLQVSKYPSH